MSRSPWPMRYRFGGKRFRERHCGSGSGVHLRSVLFSTRARGSGMGLAIVERIVREHMGRIEVDSKLGTGTTIRLVIPKSSE